MTTDAERTLNDTFDDGSDSDDEDGNGGDDRQRLMRSNTAAIPVEPRPLHDGDGTGMQRTGTVFPGADVPAALDVPARPYAGGAPYSSFSHSNDGVFANLNAKPERGEKSEEQPPVRISINVNLGADTDQPSPMRRQQQTPPHRTGKLLFWLLVTLLLRMKCTSMACLLALFSPSFGMG